MAATNTQGTATFPLGGFPVRAWPLGAWPAPPDPPAVPGVAIDGAGWASGQDAAITPGSGEGTGLLALTAIDEPASAGALPVTPSHVRRIGASWPARSVISRAGYRHTSPLEASGINGPSHRARYEVRFAGITQAERDLLRAFFRDDVRADAVNGGQFGFTLEPDGAGNGSVVVRPLGSPEILFAAAANLGVHVIESFECEEVF